MSDLTDNLLRLNNAEKYFDTTLKTMVMLTECMRKLHINFGGREARPALYVYVILQKRVKKLAYSS